jgi:hypothetical protein
MDSANIMDSKTCRDELGTVSTIYAVLYPTHASVVNSLTGATHKLMMPHMCTYLSSIEQMCHYVIRASNYIRCFLYTY